MFLLLLVILVLDKKLLLVDYSEFKGGVIIVIVIIIDLILNQHRKHSQVMLLTQLQFPDTIDNTQLDQFIVILIVVIILINFQELLNIPPGMYTLWIVK